MSDLPNSVTKEQLDNLIARSNVEYAVFGKKLTVAVITLPNNFKVTGEASCVDANNFDKALGEKYALENAVEKLWELEGYLLAVDLYRAKRESANKYATELIPCTAPKDPGLPRNIFQQEFIPNERDDSDIKFDFGIAIRKLKEGKKVMRAGWNGKGMFVYYVPAASYPVERNSKATMAGEFADDMVPYREYLALKTAQNDVSTWAPSVSDTLAEDWQLA